MNIIDVLEMAKRFSEVRQVPVLVMEDFTLFTTSLIDGNEEVRQLVI